MAKLVGKQTNENTGAPMETDLAYGAIVQTDDGKIIKTHIKGDRMGQPIWIPKSIKIAEDGTIPDWFAFNNGWSDKPPEKRKFPD